MGSKQKFKLNTIFVQHKIKADLVLIPFLTLFVISIKVFAAEFVSITGGQYDSVALRADGTVWTWGDRGSGELGIGAQTGVITIPIQVQGPSGIGFLSGVNQIRTRRNHVLALKFDGTVWAWGRNDTGQIGDGTRFINRATPVQVKGVDGVGVLNNIVSVSAGDFHSIALGSNGTVVGWGESHYIADESNTAILSPIIIKNSDGTGTLKNIIAISAGIDHSLALDYNEEVWAWGNNSNGELGIGNIDFNNPQILHPLAPFRVKGPNGVGVLTNIIAISAGSGHSLALKSDGTVWAWGDNFFGQLGDGTTNNQFFPVQVQNLNNVISIAAGSVHSLALKSDGTVWAWGSNGGDFQSGGGQLGAPVVQSAMPVQVVGELGQGFITDVTAIGAGYYNSYAIKSDTTSWAWGNNHLGQLGNGTLFIGSNAPVKIILPFPLTPSLLSPKLANSSSTIKWEWLDNATNEDGYRLISATGGAISSDLPPNTTFYVQSGLQPNTGYSAFVQAFNSVAVSNSQTITQFTFANPPLGTRITGVSESSLTAKWGTNGNPPSTIYEVQISTDSSFSQMSSSITTSLSVTFSGLTSNTTYYVRVRAENGDNIFTSFDNVVNARTLPAPDITAPFTQMVITGSSYSVNGKLFLPSFSAISFASVDPIIAAAITFGVAFTEVSLDSAPFQVIGQTQALQLQEGAHFIQFRSQDNAGNLEIAKSSTVFVDGTAPQSQVSFKGNLVIVGTTTYISTSTILIATSTDPISNGVASGIKEIRFSVDGGSFTSIPGNSAAIKMPQEHGSHQIQYSAVDNVGNAEILKSTIIFVDSIAPKPISTLKGMNPTGTTVDLTWTAPGDDGTIGPLLNAKFRIQATTDTTLQSCYNNTDACKVIEITTAATPGDQESFTVTGLFADSTYFFSIQTIDKVGNISDVSNVETAQTPSVPLPPFMPKIISPDMNAFLTTNQPTLTFSQSDPNIPDTLQFVLEITTGDFSNPVFNFTSSNLPRGPTDFVISQALAEGSYFWRVKSIDQTGLTGPYSGVYHFTIDKTSPTLTIVQPTEGQLLSSPNSIFIFSLNEISNISSIVIDSVTAMVSCNTPSLNPTCSILSPLPDGPHMLSAIASDLAGNLSQAATASFYLDTIPPQVVTDLSASLGPDTGTVTLTWTAPIDVGKTGSAKTYVLVYSPFLFSTAGNPAGVPFPEQQIAGSRESYVVKGLLPGVSYFFDLRSRDDAGNLSDFSTRGGHLIPSAVPPGQPNLSLSSPELISLINSTPTNTGQPTLRFKIFVGSVASSAFDLGYRIQISSSGDFSSFLVDAFSLSNYVNPFLAPLVPISVDFSEAFGVGKCCFFYNKGFGISLKDGDYFWRVMAIRGDGLISPWASVSNGNVGSFRVDTVPPVISVMDPAPNSKKNSVTSICGTASDIGSSVSSVTVEIKDNGTGQSLGLLIATGTEHWSISVSSAIFIDGHTYIINAITWDTAGNTGYTSSSFTIDATISNPYRIDFVKTFVLATSTSSLKYPQGIAADALGNVYFTDTFGPSYTNVQMYDSNGNLRKKFGEYGTGPGQLFNPLALTVDLQGNIYVADTYNRRIQKFDSSGAAVWQRPLPITPRDIATNKQGDIFTIGYDNNPQPLKVILMRHNSNGDLMNQTEVVGGANIAVDSHGNVLVSDGRALRQYTTEGKLIREWRFDFLFGAIAFGPGDYLYALESPNVPGSSQVNLIKLDCSKQIIASLSFSALDPAQPRITADNKGNIFAVVAVNTFYFPVQQYNSPQTDVEPAQALIVLSSTSSLKTGAFNVSLFPAESLSATPTLGYTPLNKSTIPISLQPSTDGFSWSGVINISTSTGDGIATFSWRGVDQAGNIGTEIINGKNFTIDTNPPNPITNLSVSVIQKGQVYLSWTAPFDQVDSKATAYDIRFATFAISQDNFVQASTVPSIVPAKAGSLETLPVNFSFDPTTYYFAIESIDSNQNVSFSNQASIEFNPPSTVNDLRVTTATNVSLTLNWTAPGDDGTTGQATRYDLRYAFSSIISDTDFASAVIVNQNLKPKPFGSLEALPLNNLPADTSFYFALKAIDDAGNFSGISNSTFGKILDIVPPAAVTLLASNVAFTSVQLNWVAPGDDGTTGISSSYDLRYSTLPIVDTGCQPAGACINFLNAAIAGGLKPPSPVGSSESFTFNGLQQGTTYFFALKSVDNVGNVSPISVISTQTFSDPIPPTVSFSLKGSASILGESVIATTTDSIVINASDIGSGVQKIEYSLDSTVTEFSNPVYVPLNFTSGVHFLTARAFDLAGNVSPNRILRIIILSTTTIQAGDFVWTSTNPMNVARTNHIATLLKDGKILVAGGRTPNSLTTDSAEIFDPATGNWTSTGSMNLARTEHLAALLPDGNVLVFGGWDGGNHSFKSSEIFISSQGYWIPTNNSMSANRFRNTAVTMTDGKVLTAGGEDVEISSNHYLASAEIFDPNTRLWTSTSPMNDARIFLTYNSTLLKDNRVLVAGGQKGQVDLKTAEIFNPFTGQWTRTNKDMNSEHDNAAMAILPNGNALITGGSVNTPISEYYVPGQDRWVPTSGSMFHPSRYFHTITALLDGRILVIGGNHSNVDQAVVGKTAEIYDPDKDQWSETQPLSVERISHSATLLVDGQVLVAGGNDSNGGVITTSAEILEKPSLRSVTALFANALSSSSVHLTWTAPGFGSQNAFGYDLRFSTLPIEESCSGQNCVSFANANAASDIQNPLPKGSSEEFTLNILNQGTQYYFALKWINNFGSVSPISNISSATTFRIVESTILVNGQKELVFASTQNVSVTAVPLQSSTGSFVLAVSSAQGLVPVSTVYNLGPEGAIFNPSAVMTFRYSPSAVSSPTKETDLVLYHFDIATSSFQAVSGQVLDIISKTITAPIASLGSIFVILAPIPDTTPPSKILDLRVSEIKSSSVTFAWTAPGDDGTIGRATLYDLRFATFSMDEASFYFATQVAGLSSPRISGSAESFTLKGLKFNTTYTFAIKAVDDVGNISAISNVPNLILKDLVPPGLFFSLKGSNAILPESVTAKSNDTIVVNAQDEETGVQKISYSLDGGSFTEVFSTSAEVGTNLSLGVHFLTARAVDNSGNISPDRILGIVILSTTPSSSVDFSWVTVSSMSIARVNHTATLLTDGRVLVAGGEGADGIAVRSTELYDPASGNWTAGPPMSTPRTLHRAVRLPNGNVLVMGGNDTDQNGHALNSSEIYVSSSNMWIPTGNTMTTGRIWFAAIALANGRVLAVGGQNIGVNAFQKSCDIYDPQTGLWSPTGDLNTGRLYHLNNIALLPSGVIVAGGQTLGVTALQSSEIYNPASGVWTLSSHSMNYPHNFGAMILLPNNKALISGGNNSSSADPQQSEVYDPSSDQWTPTNPMNFPRSYHTATALLDGRILVAGGSGAGYSSEIYDYKSDSWQLAQPLNYIRSLHTATLLPDGRVLVAGGIPRVIINGGETSPPAQQSAEIFGPPSLRGINDLSARTVSSSSIEVSWTAPGFSNQNAFGYDLRFSTIPILGSCSAGQNCVSFANAGFALGLPTPSAKGAQEKFSLNNLNDGTQYYFALKWISSQGGFSPISNVSSATTFAIVQSTIIVNGKAEILFLSTQHVTITLISPDSALGTQVTAVASNLGFVSLSSIYNVGPEGAMFNPPATMTFQYNASLISSNTLETALKLSHYISTRSQSEDVPNQVQNFSDKSFTAPIQSLGSIFMILAPKPDLTPPAQINDLSFISVNASSITLTWTAPGDDGTIGRAKRYIVRTSTLQIVDSGCQSSSCINFDDAALLPAIPTPQSAGATESATITGLNSFTTYYFAIKTEDKIGHISALSNIARAQTIDVTPPTISFALKGGGEILAGSLMVKSTDIIVVMGSDIGTGVQNLLVKLDGGSFRTVPGSIFELPMNFLTGIHFITAQAVDRQGNQSATKVLQVTIESSVNVSFSWVTVSSMSIARVNHTATLLTDGRVLVAGGEGADGIAVRSTELYDPVSGNWTAGPPMSTARTLHRAVRLPNGNVLVMGGNDANENGRTLNSSEIYVSSSSMWIPTGNNMSTGRIWFAATSLMDGRIIVVGGQNIGVNAYQKSCDIYDPQTDRWSPTGDLNTGRLYHLNNIALLPSGVIVAGGQTSGVAALQSSEIYNPASGVWTLSSHSMNYPHNFGAMILLPNNKALISGGNNSQSADPQQSEVYDPSSDQWTPTNPMNFPRSYHTATALLDGRILVAGGSGAGYSSEIYDYKSDSWQLAQPLNYIRSLHTATLLPDGRVLVAGGIPRVIINGGETSPPAQQSAEIFRPTGHPPSTTTDLFARALSSSTVALFWTAPGQEGTIGQASSYDLRYSTKIISDDACTAGNCVNFYDANFVLGVPRPLASGSTERFILTNLQNQTTYYFAIKAINNAGLSSAISNVSTAATFATVAVSTIQVNGQAELTLAAPPIASTQPITVVAISSADVKGSVVIATAANQGFAPASTIYDLGPEGIVFNTPALLTFHYDLSALPPGTTELDLRLYHFNTVTNMLELVPGQIIDTVNMTISAPISSLASIFMILAPIPDTTPPVTQLIITGNQVTVGTMTFVNLASSISFVATDPVVKAQTSGVDFTEFSLDNGAFQKIAPNDIIKLAEGKHLIQFRSKDKAGNLENMQSREISSDGTAPLTSFAVSGPLANIGTMTFMSERSSITFISNDPATNGVASGVKDISVTVDGSSIALSITVSTITPTAQTSPPALLAGRHKISFYALDQVKNQESAKTQEVIVDSTPPAIALVSPLGGERFIPRSDKIKIDFKVSDNYDLTPSSAAYLNLLNSTQSIVVTAGQGIDPLSIPAGFWRLTVNAVDFVGNSASSATATFEVIHDTLPPRTELKLVGPAYQFNGSTFIAGQTTLSLNATDDLIVTGDGIGLGVKETDVAIDTPAYTIYSSSFALSEGTHTVNYFSKDVINNTELTRTAVVSVDTTLPVTALTIGTPQIIVNGKIIVATTTLISLVANDPISNGVASGVKSLRFYLDTASFSVSQSTSFNFSGGTHSVSYFATDNVQNVETLRSTTVIVDVTPPVIVISTPVGGDKYVETRNRIKVRFSVVDDNDPAPMASAQLSLVNSTVVVPVVNNQEIEPLTIPAGMWNLTVKGSDFAGNSASSNTLTFEVIHDTLPPRTSLSFTGSTYLGSGKSFVTTNTTLTLTAIDDFLVLRDSAGLGVSEIDLNIDNAGNAIVASSTSGANPLIAPTFALSPDGIHTVSYFSKDIVSNTEIRQSTTLYVDNTPPVSSLNLSGPSFINIDKTYVATVTLLNLSAQDPVVRGSASGVKELKVNLDSDPLLGSSPSLSSLVSQSALSASFSLAEGTRTVRFMSVDNIGNQELTQTATVLADGTPPKTQASVQGFEFVKGTQSYINGGSRVQLIAQDPIVNGVASGLSVTYYSIKMYDSSGNVVDQTPFQIYMSTPLALTEGLRTISFYSRDNVLNTETTQMKEYRVDNTSPTVTMGFAGGTQLIISSNNAYISYDTALKFEVQDTTSNGVISGAKNIEVSVDSAPFVLFAATYGVIGPCITCSTSPFNEGPHFIRFHGSDYAGNVSIDSTTIVNMDKSPPLTQIIVTGTQFSSNGKLYVNPRTQFSLPAQDPLSFGVASGVKITQYRIDGGAVPGGGGGSYQIFSGTFSLSEGIHTVEYYSTDNVGNNEPVKSAIYYVDNTAPVTSISIATSTFFAFGTTYISPRSPIFLSAQDPLSNSVASGVRNIQYRVDNLSFRNYTTSFTISDLISGATGVHTIDYFSTDQVDNQETFKSQSVFVTVIPDLVFAGVNNLLVNGKSQVTGDMRGNGNINLVGQSAINGSVTGGAVLLVGQSTVTGSVVQNAVQISSVPIDLVQIASAIALNNDNANIPKTAKGQNPIDSNQRLILTAQDSLTLPQGNYYFKGIQISGISSLNISGRVNIYCSGDISITGNSKYNAGGNLNNLAIFVGSGAVKVDGGSELDGIVYAPFSEIDITGNSKAIGNFFGSSGTVAGGSMLLIRPDSIVVAANTKSGGKGAPSLAPQNGSGPNPAFVLGEVYSFPNPATKGKKPTIHVECGIADSVELRIYDIAGELVHEARVDGQPIVVNDRYTYEYGWDTSGVASGVYICIAVAKKSGENDIRVVRKIAVIR